MYYDYATTEKVANAKPEIMDVIQTIQSVKIRLHYMTKLTILPFLLQNRRSNANLDNVGLVSVYVNKKSTLRIILTATVTVIDMISNIGGTLGLFCGFSILSAAEIVYWVGVMLAKRRL